MTLEQALAQHDRVETNWATNFEHGWVELEVEKRGEKYQVTVVEDITDEPFTFEAGSLDELKKLIREEQLIDPDTNIWVEVPPERTRR